MTKQTLFFSTICTISLLALNLQLAYARAPIYKDDDPETVEAITEFNNRKELQAKNMFKERVGDEVASKAAQNREQVQNRVETKQQEREQNLQDKIENRCESVQARIKNRMNTYEAKKDKHMSQYNQIQQRISDLIAKLNDKGCDTNGLADDMLTLEDLIAQFVAAYRNLDNDLKTSNNFACGESEGNYVSSVRAAQANIPLILTKAKAIRTHVQTVLRPNLQAAARTCADTQQ